MFRVACAMFFHRYRDTLDETIAYHITNVTGMQLLLKYGIEYLSGRLVCTQVERDDTAREITSRRNPLAE